MAVQATTNLHGTVASDNTVANAITISNQPSKMLLTIGGTGGARWSLSSTLNTTTDNSVLGGAGPVIIPFKPQPEGGPAQVVYLYANASEATLTYDLEIAAYNR